MRKTSFLDLLALGQEFEQRLVFQIGSPAEVVDQIVCDYIKYRKQMRAILLELSVTYLVCRLSCPSPSSLPH